MKWFVNEHQYKIYSKYPWNRFVLDGVRKCPEYIDDKKEAEEAGEEVEAREIDSRCDSKPELRKGVCAGNKGRNMFQREMWYHVEDCQHECQDSYECQDECQHECGPSECLRHDYEYEIDPNMGESGWHCFAKNEDGSEINQYYGEWMRVDDNNGNAILDPTTGWETFDIREDSYYHAPEGVPENVLVLRRKPSYNIPTPTYEQVMGRREQSNYDDPPLAYKKALVPLKNEGMKRR